MGTTYRAVKGTKLTQAEGDDNFEWSSESGLKTAAEDLTFDRSGGWIHGGTGDLVTVGVTIDESVGISKAGVTGARPGTWSMFYYSGAVNPTITGASGTVTTYHNITTAGIYECWLAHKGNGDYSLSIPQAGGGVADITPPVVSAMSVEDASPNDLVVTLNSACTFTNIGYTFRVNSVARTLTSVTGNGTNTLTFLISGAAITNSDVLDLAYDSSTGDTIKSSNSVELETFAATTVTNNVLSVGTLIYQSDIPTDGIADFMALNGSAISLSGSNLKIERGGGSTIIGGFNILNSNFIPPHNVNWLVTDEFTIECDMDVISGTMTYTYLINPPNITLGTAPYIENNYVSVTGKTNGSLGGVIFKNAAEGDWTALTDNVEISEVRVYKI